MNINSKSQLNTPFLTTNFQDTSWNNQLNDGLAFTFKDGSTLSVRKMNGKDIIDVLRLEHEIFSDPWSVESFITELQNDHLTPVGFFNNILAAYAIAQLITDELHIHNLAVDPEFRRRGYGSTLLWLLLKIASLNGAKVCYLEVRRSNISAIALYEKFDFQIVGIREQYYVKENEDALLMTLSL